MTTQTETPQATEPTAEQQTLLDARQTAISGWLEAQAALLKAQEAERSAPKPSAARTLARKSRLSHGAKKANRRAEISAAELDLALTGLAIDPWVEPEQPKASITRYSKSPREIKEQLTQVRALIAGGTLSEILQHTAEQRVKALLAAAERQGVTLS